MSAVPSDRDVIVVIGSVSAADYAPIRLQLLRQGKRPLIKRIDNRSMEFVDLENYVEEVLGGLLDEADDHDFEEAFGRAALMLSRSSIGCEPRQVIAVVAAESEWNLLYESSLFNLKFRYLWPSLGAVSVICSYRDGSGRTWIDPH